MIRRAQAEALLKLAEALEECERNEINLRLCDGSHALLLAPGVSPRSNCTQNRRLNNGKEEF